MVGTNQLKILVVEATVREERSSIYPARYVTEQFQEHGHEVELFDMTEYDIPLLRERRFVTDDPHPDVEAFGQKVEDADALVLVTPEYNHSIPGALKNLLDHLYPEYEDLAFAYVTVSVSGFGGLRAQRHLQDLTLALGGRPGPALAVSNVAEHFDENSAVDAEYEEKFEEFVGQVVEHAAPADPRPAV